MQYTDFDPKKHKGEQLYEIQSREVDGVHQSVMVESDVSYERALGTPWYYKVKLDESEKSQPDVIERALTTAIKSINSITNIVRKWETRTDTKQTPGQNRYKRDILRTVQGLWNGTISKSDFIGVMSQLIPIAFERAWLDGAQAAGITGVDELTDEERSVLQERIDAEVGFVRDGSFADYIVAHSKAEGYKLRSLEPRASLWWMRYDQLLDEARGMALGDQKLRWVYGDTVDHCRDCATAEGRVYRASTWNKYGWIPGSQQLACQGYRCDCRREPTDDPVTPGRPPAMRGPE